MRERRFTNAEKAKECRRELAQRRWVYTKKFSDMQGVLPPAQQKQIAIMEEIAMDYEEAAEKDAPTLI